MSDGDGDGDGVSDSAIWDVVCEECAVAELLGRIRRESDAWDVIDEAEDIVFQAGTVCLVDNIRVEWTIMLRSGPAVGGADVGSVDDAVEALMKGVREAFGSEYSIDHESAMRSLGVTMKREAPGRIAAGQPWTWVTTAVLVAVEGR